MVLAGVAVVVLGLDQLSKVLVVDRLTPGEPVSVIDGWLQLRLLRNSGAAFSLGTGSTWVFTLIAVVVAAVIVHTARRLHSLPWAIALGLLLGGLSGNLTDRLLREPGFGRGHVVDFIEYLRFPFMDFPVFNVADSCIVSAAVLIALLGVLNIPLEGRQQGAAAEAESVADSVAEDDATNGASTDG
ncbi:MAG: signal peptidase II [Kineosporiaceae bacterium]|nr:signal peptidase II [Kineosporiaceae bacterium]MBK7624601.1 signal peptidase II [Kineosporiaceae bacterium]